MSLKSRLKKRNQNYVTFDNKLLTGLARAYCTGVLEAKGI